MKSMFNRVHVDALGYSMSTLSVKNNIISRNIANADTPFYKAGKLEFDEVMDEYFSGGNKKKLALTSEKHMQPFKFPAPPATLARHQNNPSTRNDGNDVNLDYEMSELSASSLLYQTASQITGHEFTRLKNSIVGR